MEPAADGVDIDLTREQFRRDERIGEPSICERTSAIAEPAHPRYQRYQADPVLAQRVRDRLDRLPSG